MFAALIVSNIHETPRWITEHVSFKSQCHAQPFLEGIAFDDLPTENVLGSTPIYPPDGQPLDPLLTGVARTFTSETEAQAIAVAEAVRENPPTELKRHLGRSTPIYVVDPHTQSVKVVGPC